MVYEDFAACSKWLRIAIGFCMVLQNLFESFKNFLDAPKIVDLQLGAPTLTKCLVFWIFPDFASNKVNLAARWLHLPVGF